VTNVLRDLGDGLSALGNNWTKYSVVGSFLLYVLGYLAVRFHLTAIGIGTDLSVLDERYLFAGARFLVYLVATVPSILLVLSPLAIAGWIVLKVAPGVGMWLSRAWAIRPLPIVIGAIIVAVATIQLAMRRCFDFANLLLARELPPEPAWLGHLLLDDTLMPLYFGGLVIACAISLLVLWRLSDVEPLQAGGSLMFSKGLLAFLAAVQILFLPVNYGILIMDKTFPRVTAVGGVASAAGETAWLVWEGKDGVTYLIRHPDRTRTLRTIARDQVKQTDIVGFDRIFPALFGRSQEDGR
jgi:hypothetical protein